MFDRIKTYADLIIGGVLLLILASAVAYGAWQAHKVKVLNQSLVTMQQQVSDLQAANRNLAQQVQLAQTLNRVNDAVVTATVEAHADTTATHTTIAATTQSRIETVRQKYASVATHAMTPDEVQAHATAQAREISEIQIDGLWQHYCAAAPAGSAGCAEFTSSGNAATGAATDAPATTVGRTRHARAPDVSRSTTGPPSTALAIVATANGPPLQGAPEQPTSLSNPGGRPR
jgi:hypothetical protein